MYIPPLSPPADPSAQPAAPTGARRWIPRTLSTWAFAIVPLIGVAAAYSNSLDGLYVFDDHAWILENQAIHQLWPPNYLKVTRPVTFFTFALNWAAHGPSVFGFHLVNLLIHGANSLLLFWLVRDTLRSIAIAPASSTSPLTSTGSSIESTRASLLAASIALVWAVHPLQTQAVTYIFQRNESLGATFIVGTILCWGRFLRTNRPVWLASAVALCAVGMLTKEVCVVSPVLAALYDLAFVGRSLAALRARASSYALLAGCWAIPVVVIVLMSSEYQRAGIGAVEGMTPFGYALTQIEVVCHYLRLWIYPVGQCLDYAWPLASSVTSVLPHAAVLVSLAATCFVLATRHHAGWAFLGAWFLLILAPTSSVVPIRDVCVEHRMYAPSMALAAAGVLLLDGLLSFRLRLYPSRSMPIVAVVALMAAGALGYATRARNEVYRDLELMWTDIVQVAPHNARGWANLGLYHLGTPRQDLAVEHARRAIELDPSLTQAKLTLATALVNLGRANEALPLLQELAVPGAGPPPVRARALLQLSNLARSQRPLESMSMLEQAVRDDATLGEAHLNLGAMYELVRKDESLALAHYELAIRHRPELADAYTNAGSILLRRGDRSEATARFRKALSLNPRDARAARKLEQLEQRDVPAPGNAHPPTNRPGSTP